MASRLVIHQHALDALFTSPEGGVAKDLTKRIIRVERAAKQLCPVDTGRLRASIAWELARDDEGLFALAGTNVEYGPHVEFGTRYMTAQPYLRPGLGAAQT